MVDKEYRNVCRNCVPQDCELFLKGVCKGLVEEGEFAVAKASLRVLEALKKEETKA